MFGDSKNQKSKVTRSLWKFNDQRLECLKNSVLEHLEPWRNLKRFQQRQTHTEATKLRSRQVDLSVSVQPSLEKEKERECALFRLSLLVERAKSQSSRLRHWRLRKKIVRSTIIGRGALISGLWYSASAFCRLI